MKNSNEDGVEISTEATSQWTASPSSQDDILIVPQETPDEDEINLPAVKGQAPAKLTREEVEQAARECGLGSLEVGRWGNYATVGQYLQELGAVKVAAGKFAYSNRLRMHVMRICRRAMAKTDNPVAIAKLASEINKLLDSSDSSMNEILKFVHTGVIKEPEQGPQYRLPPKGTPIVALQVTNNVGEKGKSS